MSGRKTPDAQIAANRQELADLLIELSRWSGVAEKNGDLHARIASALALESSAADVDGIASSDHHESVGERQGRRPAQDIWSDPSAARERLRASSGLHGGQNDAESVNPSSWEKADPLSDPTSGQGANAKDGRAQRAIQEGRMSGNAASSRGLSEEMLAVDPLSMRGLD